MSKQGCRDGLKELGVVVATVIVIGLCRAITGNAPAPKRAAEPPAQTATQGEPTRMRMPGDDVAEKGPTAQPDLQSQAEELKACALLADLKWKLSQDHELAGVLELGQEKVFASPLFADYLMESSQDPLEEHFKKFFLIAVQRCYANTEGGGAIWDINNRTQVLVEAQP